MNSEARKKNVALKGLPHLPLTNISNELQELKNGYTKVALLKTHKVNEQSEMDNNCKVYICSVKNILGKI